MLRSICVIIIFLYSFIGLGQHNSLKWSNKPFSYTGFIENEGRYAPIDDEQIHFYLKSGKQIFFFTANGFFIGEPENFSKNERYERHEKLEHGENIKPIEWKYIKIEFENTPKIPDFITIEQEDFTVNFQNPQNLNQTIKSKVFKRLTYQNIYPNIDLEFTIPKEGGLKYDFLVKSGGDSKNIVYSYTGANLNILENGDLNVENDWGKFIDHKPISFCEENEIESKFILTGNKVSIYVADRNPEKILRIDPWIVTTLPFTENQEGYEVAGDFEGNCSVLGEHGNEVAGYDSDGALKWVWISPGSLQEFYGDMDMNPNNGDTYYMFMGLFLGIQDVWRLNLDGEVTANIYLLPADDDPGELWRLSYNRITDQVILGVGGLPRLKRIMILDADLTTKLGFMPYPLTPPALGDITLLEIDPLGEDIYFLPSSDPGFAAANRLFKASQSDPEDIAWDVPTIHGFQEIASILYEGYEVTTGTGPAQFAPNGYNGIACSFDLYTYDGQFVFRWDKDTGAELGSVEIESSEERFTNGGIDTDPCGNVYVGTLDSIRVYTRELDFVEAYPVPDSCYDIRFTKEQLFASGSTFVQAYDFDLVSASLSSTAQTCGTCDGTVSIETTSICPEMNFNSVTWSPGGMTTTTATDLCAGWYTAEISWTNTIGDTLWRTDSIEVVLGAPGDLNTIVSGVSCTGTCNGSLEIEIEGGDPPFSYDLDGDVNETGEYTDICPGTYSLVVTDSEGCTFLDEIEIIEETGITVALEKTDEACPGSCNGTIILTPESGEAPYSYILNGDTSTTGNFTNLCIGLYTITVVDVFGCSFDTSIVIETGLTIGLEVLAQSNPTCYGFSDGSITVGTSLGEDPINYTWIPENPIPGGTYNNLPAGEYIIIASDANDCRDTITVTIDQPDSIYAVLNIIEPTCFGDFSGIAYVDSLFNAQGDLNNITYLWSPDPSNVSGLNADSSYNMPAGEYTLTINDDLGCAYIVDFSINEPEELTFIELGFEPAFCRLYDFQSGNGVVFAAAIGGYKFNMGILKSRKLSNQCDR